MEIPWQSVRTGFAPPPPNSKSQDAPTPEALENVGHRLVSLVRSLEKNNGHDLNQMKEVSFVLKNLVSIYSRRGLLQGNSEKASKIISSSTANDGSGTVTGGNRRKKGKKRSPQSLSQDNDQVAKKDPTVQDETLVLSSLVRILGGAGEQTMDSAVYKLNQNMELVTITADVITAISERIKSLISLQSTCVNAEYDIVSTSGRPILTGLSRTMDQLLLTLQQSITPSIYVGCYGSILNKDVSCKGITKCKKKQHAALASCLRASASLFTLFGTRLSRSSTLICDLQKAGWVCLTIPSDQVQRSAAAVLAAIPLTGGIQKLTPAELWNSSVTETTAAIFTIIETMAPLKNIASKGKEDHSKHISKDFAVVIKSWVQHVQRELHGNGQQGKAFHAIVTGLVLLLQALLHREGYDARAQSVLISTHIAVDYILHLAETMISFPTASESVYYGTKKRLRMEAIEGGLLNATEIAFDVANFTKAAGHAVFNSLTSSLAGPSALPFARHIMRIAHASLLTSCSGPLRRVLDPAGATRLDGKRRRWLHNSLALRAKAIESFKVSILTCGSNVVVSSLARSGMIEGNRNDSANSGICLIAGCLLEQLTWTGNEKENPEDDWGSLRERIKLTTVAADSLSVILTICRGYMQMESRSLTDSVAVTGLMSLNGKKPCPISSWAAVRCALLNLGAKCISSPWPDGAMSLSINHLRQAAIACKFDPDSDVSATAHASLSICDALANPRAPPLLTASRSANRPIGSSQLKSGDRYAGETASKSIDPEAAANLAEELRIAKEELVETIKKRFGKNTASETPVKRAKKEDLPPDDSKETDPTSKNDTKILANDIKTLVESSKSRKDKPTDEIQDNHQELHEANVKSEVEACTKSRKDKPTDEIQDNHQELHEANVKSEVEACTTRKDESQSQTIETHEIKPASAKTSYLDGDREGNNDTVITQSNAFAPPTVSANGTMKHMHDNPAEKERDNMDDNSDDEHDEMPDIFDDGPDMDDS